MSGVLSVFKQFENSELGCSLLAIKTNNDEILIPIVDAAIAIGHTHPERAVRLNITDGDIIYFKDIKGVAKFGHPLEIQPYKQFVPEHVLYKFMFRSRLPKAEQFTDWVTKEVLPDIRKTGAYTIPQRNIVPALPETPIEKHRTISDQDVINLSSVEKQIFRFESLAKSNLAKNKNYVESGRRGGKEMQRKRNELKVEVEKLKLENKFLKNRLKFISEGLGDVMEIMQRRGII